MDADAEVAERADAAGLSFSTITRLKAAWRYEYETMRERDLRGKSYAYSRADGVYFTQRLDDHHQHFLVTIGNDEADETDVLAILDAIRANANG